MEPWVRTCRRELLDRTLICNQRHLLHALQEDEQFYNPTPPASRTPDHWHSCPNQSPTRTNSPSWTSTA